MANAHRSLVMECNYALLGSNRRLCERFRISSSDGKALRVGDRNNRRRALSKGKLLIDK